MGFWLRAQVCAGACALLAMMAAGCQAPHADAVGEASGATGIAGAIIFEKQGEQTDVPRQAAGVLPLDEAVRRVLAHDPRIQAALARVRAAEAEAQQTRLLPNPILNVGFRLPEGGGQAIVEATLTGDLVAVLQMPRRIGAADKRLRSASAEAVVVVLDALAEVQETYAAVQAAEAQLGVLEERRQILDRLLGVAQARLKAGEGIRLDVITLEAQRVELEVEIAQHRLERTEQRLVLARLIGEPSSAADWPLVPWQAPSEITAGEGSWVKAALADRPEVRARQWELAALGDDVALTTLSALEGGEVGVHAERDQTWTVGPTVTTPLPVFDWGQARRAKAEAQQVEARHELTQTRRQVVEDVRRAYASYAESRATLRRAQTELVPLQEKRREQAELAYKSGEADLTTLLLAEEDLEDTRAKLVELQQKVAVAVVKLHRSVGGGGVAAAVEGAGPSTQPAATTQTMPATAPSR